MNPSGFARAIAGSVTTVDIYQTRAQRERERDHFRKVRNAYAAYAAKLRRIARHVSDIIAAYPPGDPAGVAAIQSYLQQYSTMLRPWARQAGTLMLAEVARRDQTAWMRHAKMLGKYLSRELLEPSVTGDVIRRILDDQVELISSIPLEAGRRVQELSRQYWAGGIRYDKLRDDILNSTSVTYNRATLIARTETAKTSSAVTQARAAYIGSTHYTWHTVRDVDVRLAHKKLEGTIHAWDDPPIAEANGERHHPGAYPNCRCYSVPILPAVIE